jgi:hypothetical protein
MLEFCPLILKNAIMSKITYYPTMFHTNPFLFNVNELRDTTEIKKKLVDNEKIALVANNKGPKLVSQFDLEPLPLQSLFKTLRKVFTRTKRKTSKLVNSLAS